MNVSRTALIRDIEECERLEDKLCHSPSVELALVRLIHHILIYLVRKEDK